jgi:hypothetical protein
VGLGPIRSLRNCTLSTGERAAVMGKTQARKRKNRLIERGIDYRALLPVVERATSDPSGRVLFPRLTRRERRAFEALQVKARRQADKAEDPGVHAEAFTAPRSTSPGCEDGCSPECA